MLRQFRTRKDLHILSEAVKEVTRER